MTYMIVVGCLFVGVSVVMAYRQDDPLLLPPLCSYEQAKKGLADNKITLEISKLLKGNTYIDVWRRKSIVKKVSCSRMKFYVDRQYGLVVDKRLSFGEISERRDLQIERWNENSIHGFFNIIGHTTIGAKKWPAIAGFRLAAPMKMDRFPHKQKANDGSSTENDKRLKTKIIDITKPYTYEDYLQVFYADDNVLGFYSCSAVDSYWNVVITVVENKKDDPKTLESLKSAEVKLDKLKPLIPEDMAKLSQTYCH